MSLSTCCKICFKGHLKNNQEFVSKRNLSVPFCNPRSHFYLVLSLEKTCLGQFFLSKFFHLRKKDVLVSSGKKLSFFCSGHFCLLFSGLKK
uniref:Ovule protein n=1 Tax=Panagrolaimus sp. JU765 TaxID=591449 RepID=A0AC34QZ67_9BILA